MIDKIQFRKSIGSFKTCGLGIKQLRKTRKKHKNQKKNIKNLKKTKKNSKNPEKQNKKNKISKNLKRVCILLGTAAILMCLTTALNSTCFTVANYYLDGTRMESYPTNGSPLDNHQYSETGQYVWKADNKTRNKRVKMINGNTAEKKVLTVVHWNQGPSFWNKKISELELLINDFRPDILTISEANIMIEMPEHELLVTGYRMIKPNTLNNLKYCRLAVLIREDLGIDVETIPEIMDEVSSTVWLKIRRKGKRNLILGSIYREHQLLRQDNNNDTKSENSQISRWNRILNQWTRASKMGDTHVIGDLNLDKMRWLDPPQHQKTMIESTKNAIETEGFFQLVKGATRSWIGQRDSMVDHSWTNNPGMVLETRNIPRGPSDHNVILSKIRMKGVERQNQEQIIRDWKKFDLNRFKTNLKKLPWDQFYQITELETANLWFENHYMEILNRECPLKTYQPNHKRKSWLSAETQTKFNQRDKLKETARLSQEQEDWSRYRTMKNICTREMRKDKLKFKTELYEKIGAEHNTKKLYKIVKQELGWGGTGPPQTLVINGDRITSPRELANKMQNFYTVKVKKLLETLPRIRGNPFSTLESALVRWGDCRVKRPIFETKPSSERDILNILRKMGNSTTFGHDFMDTKSLKLVAEIIAKPICHLANMSIGNGKFPTRWKTARIIPLYKGKGADKTNPAGYRPISLLPALAKITERVVQLQVQEFLETTKQLNNNHHAYRKNMNTTTTLLQLSEAIMKTTDKNWIATAITIDESAAFDCVSVNILLRKLQLYNIGPNTLKWFQEYLNGRRQHVTIGGKCSQNEEISRGVPQGSVLGPLLYTVFVNELPETIKEDDCDHYPKNEDDHLFGPNCEHCGEVPCYADDATYIVGTMNRTQSQIKIKNALQKISEFLTNNELIINQAKTTILESMTKQKRNKQTLPQPQLHITKPTGEIKTISPLENIRILGVNISQNLLYNNQLEGGDSSLLPEIRRRLGSLKFISRKIPTKSRLNLANGIIMSRIVYGIPLWGGTLPRNIRKIQTAMNRTARWISNLPRKTKTVELMQSCNWLTALELIQFHSLLSLWKIINKQSPFQLWNKLNIDDNMYIDLRMPRLMMSQLTFLWRSSQHWNNLPEDLRHNKSYLNFKKKLKLHLTSLRNSNVPPSPSTTPPNSPPSSPPQDPGYHSPNSPTTPTSPTRNFADPPVNDACDEISCPSIVTTILTETDAPEISGSPECDTPDETSDETLEISKDEKCCASPDCTSKASHTPILTDAEVPDVSWTPILAGAEVIEVSCTPILTDAEVPDVSCTPILAGAEVIEVSCTPILTEVCEVSCTPILSDAVVPEVSCSPILTENDALEETSDHLDHISKVSGSSARTEAVALDDISYHPAHISNASCYSTRIKASDEISYPAVPLTEMRCLLTQTEVASSDEIHDVSSVTEALDENLEMSPGYVTASNDENWDEVTWEEMPGARDVSHVETGDGDPDGTTSENMDRADLISYLMCNDFYVGKGEN